MAEIIEPSPVKDYGSFVWTILHLFAIVKKEKVQKKGWDFMLHSGKQRIKEVVAYKSAYTLFEEGMEAERKRRPRLAEVLYRKAINEEPTLAEAWNNLGSIEFDKKNFEEAEKCYQKAVEIRPKYAQALYSLGVCLEDTDRKAEALHYYRRAIRADASYQDAYYNVAILYRERGIYEKELEYWTTYCNLRKGSISDKSFLYACSRVRILTAQIRRKEALQLAKTR